MHEPWCGPKGTAVRKVWALVCWEHRRRGTSGLLGDTAHRNRVRAETEGSVDEQASSRLEPGGKKQHSRGRKGFRGTGMNEHSTPRQLSVAEAQVQGASA